MRLDAHARDASRRNGILYIDMTSDERTGEILDDPADLSWHDR
jgi:hypothetical protein